MSDRKSFLLRQNAQLTYQSLKIGAGNFRTGKYLNQQGEEVSGLTAGLWVYYREDASLNRAIRVHPGQELSVSQYTILVTDVIVTDGVGKVALQINS